MVNGGEKYKEVYRLFTTFGFGPYFLFISIISQEMLATINSNISVLKYGLSEKS